MKTQFSKMPRKAFGSRQSEGKSFKFANSMRTSTLFAKNARESQLMSHLKIVSVGFSRCMYLSSPDGGGGGGGCGAGHFTFVVVNQTTHNHYYGKYRTTFRKKEHAEEVTFEDVTEKKKDATVEVNVYSTPNAYPKTSFVICEFIVPGQAGKHQPHIDDKRYHDTELGYRFKTWPAPRFVEYLIGEEKKGILDFHGLIHKDIYEKLTGYYGYPKYNVKTFCRHCSFKNWHGERKMK